MWADVAKIGIGIVVGIAITLLAIFAGKFIETGMGDEDDI